MEIQKEADKNDIQGVHTEAQINQVKQKIESGDKEYKEAYNQFKVRADEALNRTSHAVENYFIPWYYVKPNEHIENSKALTGDAYAAYACALAYRLSNEKKYAEKARELLNSWATINKTLKPVEDTALVTAYGGVGLINAAELLEVYPNWKVEKQDAFKAWVVNNYQPTIDSIKDNQNNWGCWGTMAAMTIYCYLNDVNGVNGEIERLKTLIDSQIVEEGYLPEEARREKNSMWYHYFALAPMTAAAQIAKNATDTNLFEYNSPKGVSIKTALDYYETYVKDPNAWPHYDPKDLNKPKLSNGADKGKFTNWPTSLYTAMSYVYPDSDYAQMVQSYQPVMGGWDNQRGAHHIAWCFPSLMRP